MLFCQFAKSQSVRDISNGLRSATENLNHLGVERASSKSNLSYQNKHRDWTALITIPVLKALKARAKYNWHLSNPVAFIRLNLFVKIDLQLWLDEPFEELPKELPQMYIQGALF